MDFMGGLRLALSLMPIIEPMADCLKWIKLAKVKLYEQAHYASSILALVTMLTDMWLF